MSRETLTKAQVLERFGESPKQLEHYVAEGMPCTGIGRSRRFPWPEIARWRDERVRRLARDAVQRTQPTDIDEAKRRKETALAERAEIEVAQLRGDVIPLDLHEERVEAIATRLSGRCRGLDRYIADVQRATTGGEAKAILDRISDDLLGTLQAVADDLADDASDEPADPS